MTEWKNGSFPFNLLCFHKLPVSWQVFVPKKKTSRVLVFFLLHDGKKKTEVFLLPSWCFSDSSSIFRGKTKTVIILKNIYSYPFLIFKKNSLKEGSFRMLQNIGTLKILGYNENSQVVHWKFMGYAQNSGVQSKFTSDTLKTLGVQSKLTNGTFKIQGYTKNSGVHSKLWLKKEN